MPPLAGTATEQSGRELTPGGATTGAQAAALQITGLRPALPQYARRCPQHIQPSAASCLSLDSSDLPIRCGCAMAQRDRRRMKPSPLHLISAETAQLDNAPTGCRVGAGPACRELRPRHRRRATDTAACRRCAPPSRPNASDRSAESDAGAAVARSRDRTSKPIAAPFRRRRRALIRPAVPPHRGSSGWKRRYSQIACWMMSGGKR